MRAKGQTIYVTANRCELAEFSAVCLHRGVDVVEIRTQAPDRFGLTMNMEIFRLIGRERRAMKNVAVHMVNDPTSDSPPRPRRKRR